MTTQDIKSNSQTTQEAEQEGPLQLFNVVLYWNPNNDEEGTFGEPVWAKDEDDAVLALATRMSEHSDSGCETDSQRQKYINALVQDAETYAATRVSISVVSDLERLLAGPSGEMTQEAKTDYQAIMATLEKYGIELPQANHSSTLAP